MSLEEQLGESIPLDVPFLDETGNEVALSDFFGSGKPVIINFVYHQCPMLCSIALESFMMTMKDLPWAPGDKYEVVTISFGEDETPEMAAAAKKSMILRLGKPEAASGWHFLVGEQENIRRVTNAVGYHYKWVESTQDYAHPATLVFTSEKGVITRYLHGVNYPATNVRRAVIEASEGTVGSTLDQVLLYCYRYDPDSNSYVLHATNLMKLGGLFTLIVMGLGLFVFWRKERDKQHESLTQV